MNLPARISKLETQLKPRTPTLAEAIGGLLILDALPDGRLRLPDGRELTPAEFDTLAAAYPARGTRHILVMDNEDE